MLAKKQGARRFTFGRTPEQDQPKTKRAYPLAVRSPGVALPVYRGGTSGNQRVVASHPFYGTPNPVPSFKRVDLRNDVRRELDA